MKTKMILFVVALLVASTTLTAENAVCPFDDSTYIHQTEALVKQLNLNKKQAKKVLSLNKKYAHKKSLLNAQRKELDKLGFLDDTVMGIYFETLSKFENDKKEALKTIVKSEQWIAYEGLLTENN